MRSIRPRQAITLRARGARTVPQCHVMCTLAIVLVSVLVLPPPAAASLTRPEHRLATMTNMARNRHQLPRLIKRVHLTTAAERQSRRMAERRQLFHGSLAWTSGRHCWGQNVGYGPTVRAVFRAFMLSADHRANMLDRCYGRSGYGVVKAGGGVWVTIDFAR